MRRQMHSQSGQVGIAIILIMVVVSTIGISVAQRSAADVTSSRQSQEASQTFSAAESALEDILSQGETYLEDTDTGTYEDIENVTVNYTIDRANELDTELLEGTVFELDLTGSAAGQQVAIEWSETDDCSNDEPAAIVVSVVNQAGTATTWYRTYTICDRSDGFTLVATNGTTYERRVAVTLQAGDVRLRITPVYNDTNILVNGQAGLVLGTQQYTIRSVARNDLGRETKAIEVQRTTDAAPSILDYSVISGTSLVK